MTGLAKLYLEELARIQERLRGLFERALLPAGPEAEATAPGRSFPPVDLVETAGGYRLTAELPGLARDEVELRVTARTLELSGRVPPVAGKHRFLRMERAYGPFRRSFTLDRPVDADGIEARLDGGILTVTIPGFANTPQGERDVTSEENDERDRSQPEGGEEP